MGLQFQPPPDWLIQEYMNRKHPVAQAAEGIQGVLGTYMQLKGQQDSLASLDAQRKATEFKAVADYVPEDQIPGVAKQYGINIPQAGSTPPIMSTGTAITPNEMAAQQSLPSEHPAGVPDVSQPTSFIERHTQAHRPTSKAGLAKYKTNLDISNSETKAEETGPKPFDYARTFATNAGAPQDAEGFINLAKSEGRSTLTKREMDDLKNSISAKAQQGRGEYFQGQLGLNKQKFENQLLQEGNKALNPNVAGGALKPQQERLNRIGRAEALVTQMKGQVGGGDTRQMRELATSLASVLTGGNVVAEQQINELIPQTYKGDLKRFYEKLSNNPTGLEQQAFVTRLADTLARERGTIHTQINVAQKQALPGLGVLQKTNPSGYNQIMEANVKPTVGSQQEYDALLSGTEYLSGDGVLHRKK